MKQQTTHILVVATILAVCLEPALGGLLGTIEGALGKGLPAPAPVPPLPMAPREFVDEACTSASDRASCKTIVRIIVNRTPHDEALNATKVALRSARKVQNHYKDVALNLKDKIQQLKPHDRARLKPALTTCYKIYMEISHEMHQKTMHLKLHREVCTGKLNSPRPELCEEALVKAGTTGQRLGLYKNYNDLVNLAGASDSIIAYMVETGHYKTADCSYMAPSPSP